MPLVVLIYLLPGILPEITVVWLCLKMSRMLLAHVSKRSAVCQQRALAPAMTTGYLKRSRMSQETSRTRSSVSFGNSA